MKLHLPKILLTAVIAAVCCVQQVHAADYSVYTTTAITNPETGEEETPAYGYTIVNWQGGSTGTNGAGDKKAYGLCYAGTDNNGYRQATYDGNAGFIIADATNSEIDGWAKTVTSELYRTILFDGNSNGDPDNDNRVFYDISTVKLSGIIVTGNSGVGTLWANNDARTTIIGKASGATGYTTIAKNFTLDMNGSSLTLAGTQVWNVDESCVYTIKNAQNGNIASSADLTIGGAGTVSLESGLTNTGTLTVNGTLKIAKTITNTDTLTFNTGSKLVVSSLDALDDWKAEIYDYTKSGIQTIEAGKVVYSGSGTATGLTQVYIGSTGGDTATVTNGVIISGSKNAYVITDDDTVTITTESTPEGFGMPDFFAIAETGTLNIAAGLGEKTAGTVLSETVGAGVVNLNTDATMANALGAEFTGTVNITTGKTLEMDTISMLGAASALVVNEGATLKLTNVTGINTSTALQGSGTVSLILKTPGSNESHDKGLNAANFNGVVEISKGSGNGNTNLCGKYTLGDNASFRLISGNHWSQNGTISRAIVLAGEAEDDFTFQHEGTLELAGKVTGSYLTAGYKYNSTTANNLILSGADSKIDHVKMKAGTLTVNANMAFGTVNAPTLVVNSDKTLTLGNGSSEGVQNINTLTLNGKLVVGTNTALTATDTTIGAKGTLELSSGSTVTGTIKGSGTYALGSSTTGYGTLDADNWTGTVSLKGATVTTLADYGHESSKIKLENVKANIATQTVAADVELVTNADAGALQFGGGGKGTTITFSGAISGGGNMSFDKGAEYNLEFTGDISKWNGTIWGSSTKGSLTYSGSATEINHTIQTGDQNENNTIDVTFKNSTGMVVNSNLNNTDWSLGSLNVKVLNEENATGEVVFNGSVSKPEKAGAINLEVDKDAVAKFTSDSLRMGDVTLASGSRLSFTNESETATASIDTLKLNGGVLDVAGSLTLNTVNVDFGSYFNAEQLSTTLVTAGTLNGWGEPVVGTYLNNGTQYTTTISQSGNSLVLTFAAPTDEGPLSFTVDSASLNGSVLTLNINADLTDVSSVDLMLSEAALADIKDMTGLVDLELVFTNGTYTSVAGQENSLTVSFYDGAYKGEADGQYNVQYIPEPTTATLSLLALMGMAARRRRKA